ncbi:LamG-like jellyroll fold domain-containing protein [Paludisphaera soli]|uniref:LamG-like jellyroll fold domain-containing protein n=1 Tax=Paludisphaera soli TaxID=2712865 RepID=UPI0013EA0560|nr:LamG-like jellyroll fold domain-containing protein [Paludisphaera soli]
MNRLASCILTVSLLGLLGPRQATAAGDPAPPRPWPGPIGDKTLVAWVRLADLARRGGAPLSIQAPGEEFDAIVYGEIAPRRWMAGSDRLARSQADQAANPEESAGPDTLVQVAIAYRGRRVAIYRDGLLTAAYEVAEPRGFDAASVVLMGPRHLSAPADQSFRGAIEEARLYDVALDGPTIAALRPGDPGLTPPFAHWTFEGDRADDLMGRFAFAELRGGARIADGKLWLEKPGDGLEARRTRPYREPAQDFLRYRPRTGKVGDTIGFAWRGERHVFFLNDGRWDHIVSSDLLNWRELPPALERTDDPAAPDGEACWTGSLVERDGLFHLFYTGKNLRDPKGDQKVMAATSTDLIHWRKDPSRTFYAEGALYWSLPVNGPADPVIYHHQAFRDPDVFFHEGENRWWMLLHALTADSRKPCIGLYTSPDLTTWTPRPPIAVYDPAVSLDCPHAAPVDGRWFLIAADASYATAPSPGGPYPAGMTVYDAGDLFVPKSSYDGERRILTGWIRDLEGGEDRGKPLWGGTMSAPRELFADRRGDLGVRLAREVVGAFESAALDLADRPAPLAPSGVCRYEGPVLVLAGEGGSCRFDAPDDYLLDCTVRLDPEAEFTLTFRSEDGGAGGYPLIVRPGRGEAEIRRGDSRFVLPMAFDASRPVAIQALVRGPILECFVDGRRALTCRAYDRRSGRLTLGVACGKAEVETLRIRTAGPAGP